MHASQRARLGRGLGAADCREAAQNGGEPARGVLLFDEVRHVAPVEPARVRQHLPQARRERHRLGVPSESEGHHDDGDAAAHAAQCHGLGHLVRGRRVASGNEAEAVREGQRQVPASRKARRVRGSVRLVQEVRSLVADRPGRDGALDTASYPGARAPSAAAVACRAPHLPPPR